MNAAELAHALGGRRNGSRGFLAGCPAHSDRSPSLSITDGDNGVLIHCFAGCQQSDVIDALRRDGLWDDPARPLTSRPSPVPVKIDRRRADADDDRWRTEKAQRIWREGHDPRGTLAERYLIGRGLSIDDDVAGRVLRFHPACPFGEGRTVPALVGAFHPIDEHDDHAPPTALLRVGLNRDGSKIGKMMFGPVAGAAIKIDPDEAVTMGPGIAEGIETALAVRATGWRPMWAVGSAGAIATFPVLGGIDCLTIFADFDANGVGQKAARECAERWRAAGREVIIRIPRSVGADWADLP